MEKVYAPQAIERRIYERWESHGWFAPSGRGEPYCIMIPPPNVTGTLHMGHAFQHTLMDALTRYQRMRGRDVLWQPGTDHAGIATQMVVERQLNAQGVKRTNLTREAFLERVWQWKEQSGGTISAQMRRLGDSVDWSRDRFTMDPGLSRAVIEVFVRLHEEGLIYRGKRLVNWDPVLLTALSDLEVQAHEEDGQLWHLRYPLAAGAGHVVVATTRPETMLGDAAVAVNPDDTRYQPLIGKLVQLPLAERAIPIIADAYVDPAFGSGCLKVTPAHDFNDYEIGQRHHLPLINIFTPRATLADTVPERFRGLERFEARKRVVAELQAAGLVERVEKHRLAVPRGDRGRRAGPRPLRAGGLGAHLLRMDAQHQGLVREPPAVVGTSHPGLVRQRQQHLRRPQRSRGTRAPPACRRGRAAPGRRRARYLVLLGAVAVFDARLAGCHRGARQVLSGQRAGHRLRHHLLLGRPHDDAGPEVHGRGAVP